ncbi:hypothetical protein [Chryseobacterium cheonjiense]|uniref:Uncharacterized protein n=1 Tax=Chryseobacterium cheonjiense TaxID=2728845 RepID=A0A7Y0A4V2_9FLAO|nr:hypothetical protein [Chryseobacterium cheonjiense]NML56763.1 hypothetical protein [Chryseobacterium cheonjiense]
MIKIQLPKIDNFKTEYYNLIQPLVLERLRLLKISLSHLNDPDTVDDDDIGEVKTITKNIVDTMVKPKTPKSSFNKAVYKQKIRTYQTDAKEVIDVDFSKLIELTDYILDIGNDSLKTLIIGEPNLIKGFHDDLFASFDITERVSKDVMYEAFSYNFLGDEVKDFFYKKDISDYCSYCNISKAKHTNNPLTGKVVDQYHLDHFFSQVDHPMLAVSLFNLVPSDYVCNSANKGKLLFSDIFHLNPYISGFSRDLVFEPIFDEKEEIVALDLKIKCPRDSERWKQFIGDQDLRDLAPEHGNVNVFQLFGKYNDENILWQVNKLYKTYKRAARNDRSLHELLEMLEDGQDDRYENIKNWYEDAVRTRFHENEFGKLAFSKLNRDLLDHAFAIYSEKLGEEIVELLLSSYLPEKGGQ